MKTQDSKFSLGNGVDFDFLGAFKPCSVWVKVIDKRSGKVIGKTYYTPHDLEETCILKNGGHCQWEFCCHLAVQSDNKKVDGRQIGRVVI